MWDKKVQPEMDQQWNLAVQSQASSTTTFQLGYVGQHGTHLIVPTPYLQGTLNNGVVGPTLYFQGNPTLIKDLSQVSGTSSTGFATYHAMQAVLQKRISNGLEGQVAYTWSHCMTNNSGYYGSWGSATQATTGSPYYQNLYDPHADYASCYFDSKNILAAYATYNLPIGRGKMIGKNLNPVVNSVVGGWQASTIVSLHSGLSSGRVPINRHVGNQLSRTSAQLSGYPYADARQTAQLQRELPGLSISESGWVLDAGDWELWQLPTARTSDWARLHGIRISVYRRIST